MKNRIISWLPGIKGSSAIAVKNIHGPRSRISAMNWSNHATIRARPTLRSNSAPRTASTTTRKRSDLNSGRRTSPIDGGNLNRLFPGDPDGTVELELDADLTTVTVAIHDWGRPIAALDPNALPPGLEELAGLVSDLRLVNLGADGKRTTAVLEIAAQWQNSLETDELLRKIAEASTQLLECERASIFLWDRPHKQLVGRPALGVDGNELRIPDNAGVVGGVNGGFANEAYQGARLGVVKAWPIKDVAITGATARNAGNQDGPVRSTALFMKEFMPTPTSLRSPTAGLRLLFRLPDRLGADEENEHER